MRKLLIILIGVIILYLSSIIYREKTTPVTTTFPLKHLGEEPKSEAKLNLILFFSMNNCPPCLKVIDFLNQPPEGVRVVGIIPEKEIHLLSEIRQTTGAAFPIYGVKQWKRYRPIYAPTLFGVGGNGIIYFMLPCVGLEETYLPVYLDEFMRKARYLLQAPKR
ncbi:MAG: hypothetical protein DRJ11_11825 [Candidatus Aminicenantes bacterium]|nr:MAG: hypothetical protein DRJ11_11825 [Candidatus Aminicenantes bacterium]